MTSTLTSLSLSMISPCIGKHHYRVICAPKHIADLLAEAYISSVYTKFSQHEQLILNTMKEIPPKFYRRVYD